jgi:ABC-2 type transport system ATP-binding protein
MSVRLEIRDLAKRYATGSWAVSGLSLDLGPCVLGLLGPNGAGKSTVMRMLATISRPTSGTITWNGADVAREPDRLRAALGYLPQDFGVYPNLSAQEFLDYIAAVKGLEPAGARRRIAELLDVVNLAGVAHRPLGGYSGGMKQRVGIAQALLNDPRVLIVDEPTVGLDPEERVRFRNLLSDLAGDRIIILSTHIVSDVEAAATEIAVMDRGVLKGHWSPEQMLQIVDGKVWEWVVASEQLPAIKQHLTVSGVLRRADGIHVRVVAAEAPSATARTVAPNLEDAYLYLVAGARERVVA